MKEKFKKGAASFYIVAFSTLIMVIIAASFAAIIISEVTRTSNDDLAQSAYDSALAGVEDAKLAFYNYQSCMGAIPSAPDDSNGGITCNEIVYWMEGGEEGVQDCDTVAHILGRINKNSSGEVLIQESSEAGNNMQQAYTCVKVTDTLGDYRGTLSSSNQSRVIRARFDDDFVWDDGSGRIGVEAKDIKSIKISWYSQANRSGAGENYNNFKYSSAASGGSKVIFPKVGIGTGAGMVPTPPTISVGLVQTAGSFKLSDFDVTINDQTDRGMIYLVPTDKAAGAATSGATYIGAYDGISENIVSASGVAKSNDKTQENLPYVVYCDEASDPMCSATIMLPEPVGGDRNDDTFVIVVSLPYGQPNTDFILEFYCADGKYCGRQTVVDDEGTVLEEGTERASLKWVQIGVDSTGRANDLYRRVETRMEGGNAFALSSLGVLEILGDGGADSIWKNFSTTCEYDFDATCSR